MQNFVTYRLEFDPNLILYNAWAGLSRNNLSATSLKNNITEYDRPCMPHHPMQSAYKPKRNESKHTLHIFLDREHTLHIL